MIKFHTDWEDFKNDNLCNAWVAVAIVGASVVGGAVSAYSANQASNAQTNAANTASQTAMAQYGQTRSDLAPYRGIGATASTDLTNRLTDLTKPITMDQATLEATPGYQFNKTQGLKAVQNSAAARGLGVSGAALKGAATFATGLADNTYQNQFANAQTNQANAFNRLKSLVDTGENAAAQTGVAGATAAGTSASAAMAAGNAQAAGYNAIGNAATNVSNNVNGYLAYRGLYGGGSGTSPSGPQMTLPNNFMGSGSFNPP